MKQYILACCLLALATSIHVPQDKLQPDNNPAKAFSSHTDPSVSKTLRAHSTFGNVSGHDIAQVPSSDTDSDSGSSSGHDSENSSGPRRKTNVESKGSASSVEEKVAESIAVPIVNDTTTLSYEEESYATDIFDWEDV